MTEDKVKRALELARTIEECQQELGELVGQEMKEKRKRRTKAEMAAANGQEPATG